MKKLSTIPAILAIVFLSTSCRSQPVENPVSRIDKELSENKTTISKILSADSLMYLHSQTAFREIIKKHAKAGKFSMMSPTEPGTRVTIKASMVDKQNNPVKNALVYVYQTSDKGWYSDTAAHILVNSGDINHARLFAYLRTDEEGNFLYETVKPNGYPNSDFAGHIHIHFWDKYGRTLHGTGELQFDDDPRMTDMRRAVSMADGYLISRNSGTVQIPVYEYKIIVQ